MNDKDVKRKETTGENDFVLKSLKISSRAEVDEYGRKDYRTVFVQEGLTTLYVDLEGAWEGKGRPESEGEIKFTLFRIEEKGALGLGAQVGNWKLATSPMCSVEFQAIQGGYEKFPVGIYGVVAQWKEQSIQSEPVSIMEGNGELDFYFRPLQIGIDKCCGETEEEARQRNHSFSSLDIRCLEDVCFYFLAENQLSREWVYEFVIQLVGSDGWVKTRRVLKGKQFIQGEDGKLFLCFSVILLLPAQS